MLPLVTSKRAPLQVRFEIGGTPLSLVNSMRDLGVIVDIKLNPRPAGVFGRTRPAGGGQILPLPLSNSRTDGRRKTGKTANESSQQDES